MLTVRGGVTAIVKTDPAANPAESVAVIVNVDDPATVGVPLITPVEESRVNPLGNDPEPTDQVYGAVPPSAATMAA